MNERIKELTLEAGFAGYGEDMGSYDIPVPAFNSRMEWFVKLIVKECIRLLPEDCQSKDGCHTSWTIKEHFGMNNE